MLFQKQDLLGNDYSWSRRQEHELFSGQPTRRKFDRNNGDQLLFIINCYFSVTDSYTIEKGREIEKLLIQQLPMGSLSEITVVNWLMETEKLKN